MANSAGASSVLEIATSILAAAMTALRPLLVKLPCFRSLGSSGKVYPRRVEPPNDQYASLGLRGPSYRLDDVAVDHSRSDSQEHMVRPVATSIRKHTEIKVISERQTNTRTYGTKW